MLKLRPHLISLPVIRIAIALVLAGSPLNILAEPAAVEKTQRAAANEDDLAMTSLMQAAGLYYACKMYATDNGGTFPPNLKVLFPNYINSKKPLICPLSSKEKPTEFEYKFGNAESKPDDVLIQSPQLTSDGRRVIVRRNGKREIVQEK
ncbi:MAG: hypothetical protein ACO1QR_04280 [Chthoniobacteraceae bacterium]